METVPASALENLYQMVIKDFIQITQKYNTSSKKDTEETSKDKDKTEEKFKDTIHNLLNKSFRTITSISNKKRNDHNLYESINNYVGDIKDYIIAKSDNKISTVNTEENDIYRAYGFLWSVRYLLKDAELEHISLFNYKEYSHFSIFLENFGNSKNISKNYHKNFKNFMEEKGEKKIDVKLVHEWIRKLNEGKLSPMAKSTKSLKKNKKKLQDDKNDTQTAQISNDINNNNQNNIENLSQKEEKEKDSNNIINIEAETSKNDIINFQQEKKSEKNGKGTEDSSEDNKNKNIQNTISSDNSNNSENETINGNNNSDKNKNNVNDIVIEKTHNVPSVDLVIKGEKNNLIDLCKNIGPLSQETIQLINLFSSQFASLENKITQQNLEISKNREEIKKNRKEISKNKEEISKNEREISALQTENETLSDRVQKLEVNQLMLYHQISLYQNSRDMYKSISYYFYEYLNLKQVQTTKFGKTKAIIEYLENKDEEKVKK